MTALSEAEVTTHPAVPGTGTLALPAVGAAPTMTTSRQAGTGEEAAAAVTMMTPQRVGKEQEEAAAAVTAAAAVAAAAAQALHPVSMAGPVGTVGTPA